MATFPIVDLTDDTAKDSHVYETTADGITRDLTDSPKDNPVTEAPQSIRSMLLPEPGVSPEEIVALVLTGQGEFAGADAETQALLDEMKKAFAAGVLYGTAYTDEFTTPDELEAAFQAFVLSRMVASAAEAAGASILDELARI